MKKNNILIMLAVIIVIGILVIFLKGFNVSILLREHKIIDIYISQQFEPKDVKKIAKEVFTNQDIVVQKSTNYEDIATISLETVSQEQIEQLVNKINEKYLLEIKIEEINVYDVPKLQLRDIFKEYLLPVICSFLMVLVYFIIRYKQQGILNILYKTVVGILGINLFYISLLAITRCPINIITISTLLPIYLVSIIIINYFYIKNK